MKRALSLAGHVSVRGSTMTPEAWPLNLSRMASHADASWPPTIPGCKMLNTIVLFRCTLFSSQPDSPNSSDRRLCKSTEDSPGGTLILSISILRVKGPGSFTSIRWVRYWYTVTGTTDLDELMNMWLSRFWFVCYSWQIFPNWVNDGMSVIQFQDTSDYHPGSKGNCLSHQ